MDVSSTWDATALLCDSQTKSYSSLTDATSSLHHSESASSHSSFLWDAGGSEERLPESRRKDAGGHLGLLCVTTSAFLFGVVAALVKSISMNIYVMLEIRGALQWLFSIAAVWHCLPASRSIAARFFGESHERPILFLRSGLYWAFISLFWSALAKMPMGDATTLCYCAPLFTAFFGWLLLGERVPLNVFVSLALSMIGVGLITRPTFLFGQGTDPAEVGAQYNDGMLCAFGGAVVGGLLPVLVRKTKECHWATVSHVTTLCSCTVFTPAAMALMASKNGAAPEFGTSQGLWDGLQDPNKLFMLGLVALVGFAGLGLQTYGYQREHASRASAMNFLEIPFSYILQYLMFGDLLAPTQGLGMLLVIVSGLINLGCGWINFCPREESTQTSKAQSLDGRQQSSRGLGKQPADFETPQISNRTACIALADEGIA